MQSLSPQLLRALAPECPPVPARVTSLVLAMWFVLVLLDRGVSTLEAVVVLLLAAAAATVLASSPALAPTAGLARAVSRRGVPGEVAA